ncbi:hypothetical protein ACR6HW_09780 [Fusibacter sp. JL298sf-3]
MVSDRSGGLRNCKKCNRLFSAKEGEFLCSRCNDEVDDEFTKVREYIYDNPTSGVKDVSASTGVHVDVILKWIKEGRILLSERTPITFCERCGEPSDGARYCKKCVHELSVGLKSGIQEKSTTDRSASVRGGMHIREKRK